MVIGERFKNLNTKIYRLNFRKLLHISETSTIMLLRILMLGI